jgi:error-prone DNA polymerase
MYVELQAASAFSFLEASALPEDLAHTAAGMGMPAMALADRDGVYGAPRFHLACREAGIRPHVGAEITVRGGDRYPLLVETAQGYRNLCRLITLSKMRARKGEGSATLEDLAEHAAGLVCLTGDARGPLAGALREGGVGVARECLGQLVRIFGRGQVYVALQRHLDRESEARLEASLGLAREAGLPIVATNSVRYTRDREVLDVFTAIRHHRTLETAGRLLAPNDAHRLRSPREMAALFRDLPEAVARTAELSSRLRFTMDDLGYRFPPYPVPANETMDSFLRKRTFEGALRRYRPLHEKARRQLEHELAVISRLGLAGYFLIVWDIVGFCRSENILVQGRGSAANSAVCYALGITAVDPVGMDLLFERFLSEERGEWPDIDLDLPSGERRERAIQYVYQRYGRRGAAMTANVITYRGRSGARETGKALGFDRETLDRVAKLASRWEYQDANDGLDRVFRSAGLDPAHPRIRKFLDLTLRLQKLPRHLGQHSGGLVICQGTLDEVVPLEPAAMPGRTVVQWDKDDCASMGIIKVDLLGLGMMAVLEDSIDLIRHHDQKEVDLARLPPDDPLVYETLSRADTVGMFQIESRAQMSCLPRLRPARFYDLVVQVAIIRPGPIVGQMVHPYLRRRQGREKVTYPHPALEAALERTLGVPLFQEQLLKVAMIAAGFSGGEAEELRRAFGFKRSGERMESIEVKLRRGMEAGGITGEAQDGIVRSITSFALYGFPESHAASFALIAYASAYLKCHYPASFTAAILNNQPMGFYSPATLVKDARRHGLRVRPIDVAASEWRCSIESVPSAKEPGRMEQALRIGLNYVRGLREVAALALLRERRRRSFDSIDDLAGRVPELRKDEMALLAEVGALNFIRPDRRIDRRDALWQVERAGRPSGPLFEDLAEPDAPSPLAPMSPEERLVSDYRVSGLTTGPHPMALARPRLEKNIRTAADLASLPNGAWVRIAGCVIARQRPGTAKGFVFMSLEDESGIANAIFAPDILERNRAVITTGRFLLIEGPLQHQDGVISVRARKVRSLPITRAPTASRDFH